VLVIPLFGARAEPARDALGALVLLLAGVLVTSAERSSGAPQLAVLCAGLLMRDSPRVGLGRWRQLSGGNSSASGPWKRWERPAASSGRAQAALSLGLARRGVAAAEANGPCPTATTSKLVGPEERSPAEP